MIPEAYLTMATRAKTREGLRTPRELEMQPNLDPIDRQDSDMAIITPGFRHVRKRHLRSGYCPILIDPWTGGHMYMQCIHSCT